MHKISLARALMLLGTMLLTTGAVAEYSSKRGRPPIQAKQAIVHQSGGTVAQPYVRRYETRPYEESPVTDAALDRRNRVFKLHRELQHEGIQFVRVGEDLTLILHSEDYFYQRSPRILESERVQRRLWLVAEYLNCYNKLYVNVDVYTSGQDSMRRNLALSQGRADKVADSLYWNKVDTRLVVAKGHGADQPIANDKTKYGQEMNDRVEISIRMIAPDSAIRRTAW